MLSHLGRIRVQWFPLKLKVLLKDFSSQVSSTDTALAWVREVASSSPASPNALVKIGSA